METTLDIDGMHCASCAAGIETFLTSQDGVNDAEIDFDTQQAHLDVEDDADLDSIVAQIRKMGYEVDGRL